MTTAAEPEVCDECGEDLDLHCDNCDECNCDGECYEDDEDEDAEGTAQK